MGKANWFIVILFDFRRTINYSKWRWIGRWKRNDGIISHFLWLKTSKKTLGSHKKHWQILAVSQVLFVLSANCFFTLNPTFFIRLFSFRFSPFFSVETINSSICCRGGGCFMLYELTESNANGIEWTRKTKEEEEIIYILCFFLVLFRATAARYNQPTKRHIGIKQFVCEWSEVSVKKNSHVHILWRSPIRFGRFL